MKKQLMATTALVAGGLIAGVAQAADSPCGVPGPGDEEGDAALRDEVLVPGLFAAEEADEDVDGEDDERGSDEAFADGVHACREAEMEEDDGGSEKGDSEGVT